MQASELRHKISFQSATTSSDGMGGKTASGWVTDKIAWAKIISNGADVNYENGQTRGVKSFTIIIRYQPDIAITHKTRVLWGDRVLTPNVTINTDHLKHWMTFEATEFTG